MTTGLTLSARCMHLVRAVQNVEAGSGHSAASSADRAIQWLAISTNARVVPISNNSAARRRSGVSSRVLRLCRVVRALLPSRYDNGIGAQRPNPRQSLFRRCIHRRCTGAAFPDMFAIYRGSNGPLLLLLHLLLPLLPTVNPATRRAGFEHRETIDIHRDVLDVRDRRMLPGAWRTASAARRCTLAFCLSRDLNSLWPLKVGPTRDCGSGETFVMRIVKQSVVLVPALRNPTGIRRHYSNIAKNLKNI